MSLPQPLILTIIHDVETYVPVRRSVRGMLTIGKDDKTIFFKWSQYPNEERLNTSNSPPRIGSPGSPNAMPRIPANYNHQVYLLATQIQKIIITPQEQSSSIIISTVNPSEMHNFTIKSNNKQSCLQILQVLATNSASEEIKSSESWNSIMFQIASLYVSELAPIYDISCDNGVFSVPIVQVQTSIPNVDELEKVKIAACFGVENHHFVGSPITEKEMDGFLASLVSLNELKAIVGRRGLSDDIRGFIWPRLLGVLSLKKDCKEEIAKRVAAYKEMKGQWESLTSFQLTRRNELRYSYQTIRLDVKRTFMKKGEDEDKYRKVLTNILKTYAVWNYNIRYTQGMNDLLVPFLMVFSRSKEYNDDEVEALSFWCFATFIEKIETALIESNIDGIMCNDLPSAVELLREYDPNAFNWISENEIGDMSFIASSFMLAYRRSFEEDQIERIWDSVMSADNPRLFMIALTASLIIFSYPTFSRMGLTSTAHLLPVCDKVLSQQPIGSVIGVSSIIYSKCMILPRRNVSYESISLPRFSFFSPKSLTD